MFKRIREMWNRAMRPFYVPGPSSIINNYGEMYRPVLEAFTPKQPDNIFVNGREYEWWVHANTAWPWPEYFSVGKSPNYEIYRQVDYDGPDLFEEIFKDGSPLVELMADEAHRVWAQWMEYQFTKGTKIPTGGWIMDEESFWRWQRQSLTVYSQLPESEKASDREIAKRYLRLILDG